MEQFHHAYPFAASAFGTEFMTAMLLLGAFVGCIFMPYVADRFSRKWALMVVVVIFDIGAILQTAAPNYAALVAGRFIGGIGVGTLAMMVTATALGLGIHFFPYSPRWLALVNRHDDCLRSLTKLRGFPSNDDRVQAEFQGIIAEITFQKFIQAKRHPEATAFKLEFLSWLDLFSRKSWKRTAVGAGVGFFQQFSGINAFIYYAPALFQALGQSSEQSLILSAIYGGFACAAAYTVIAVLSGLYSADWKSHLAAGWGAVAMAFVFILAFGVSYSPLGWGLFNCD
ncbi:hypothetical protein CNMCM8980_000448 [Aspergillus fumigatiaffinis]|uniref:Major facilitator superfamily (MFS) profile domain-containing protein n=1 Tax=Aspergillus fumigatiaffinis TaxID=340414 RepID=A0A8H4HCU7_9EURO|nr:hypothetical protein CNMCM6805_003235 [Aspergillus fumigatiaffinis]KAF4250618.1 hypothetical protein CNMCM8980_000448 [Aspergillus fumigatiaffinis]